MPSRIHQLDNRLANQVAAGEVVERPASVVKELLENAVDADSGRIEIDIERGGTRLIRIIDNGVGIHKDDLTLALSRHATSKISSFNELMSVSSMGFRGEALASIASVSRLLLRTRQAGEELAWQANAEGRDMSVKITPAASTVGTCVEVRDLFFNTPARRKFLRTEKTEFAHIEDVVKRIALAYPTIAMVLKHNQKVVKRYPACASRKELNSKLSAVCGRRFVDNSAHFSGDLDDLKIEGWLVKPDHHRSESDQQFIFINQRVVKDRLLTHAVRQSYSALLPPGRFASYVIFIDCPANQVDVNVHPTKHEVRFRDPRQIHDFLVKLISQCLSELSVQSPPISNAQEWRVANESQSYSETANTSVPSKLKKSAGYRVADSLSVYASTQGVNTATDDELVRHNDAVEITEPRQQGSSFGLTNSTVQNRFVLQQNLDEIWLIDLWHLAVAIIKNDWLRGLANDKETIDAQPLIVPQSLGVHEDYIEQSAFYEAWRQIGFEFSPLGESQIMLRKLPKLAIKLPVALWHAMLQSLLGNYNDDFQPRVIIKQIEKIMLGEKSIDLRHYQDFNLAVELNRLPNQELESWRASSIKLDPSKINQLLGKSL